MGGQTLPSSALEVQEGEEIDLSGLFLLLIAWSDYLQVQVDPGAQTLSSGLSLPCSLFQ